MTIVFFTHPNFLESESMPRFANMLAEGMVKRGHKVEILTAKPYFFDLPGSKGVKKWMGYIDQYLIFPFKIKRNIGRGAKDTLYIFTDQALGPWMPLVTGMPHVVHCHDFLAQRSALDQIPINRTGWTGRRYQAFIRRGYSKAKNFISVSQKTQLDLHEFLKHIPPLSEVVYNGLNKAFVFNDCERSRQILEKHINVDVAKGYILHVGGNQWYKNRVGVVEVYNTWRKRYNIDLPLLLIGQSPSDILLDAHKRSDHKKDIYFLSNINDELINIAYSGASLFLFPSIAEGFGWPIAEAMASGCPVITTGEAPMTEVAGDAAYLVRGMPEGQAEMDQWANNVAEVINKLLSLTINERRTVVDKGLLNAKRFNTEETLDRIEEIYLKVLEEH